MKKIRFSRMVIFEFWDGPVEGLVQEVESKNVYAFRLCRADRDLLMTGKDDPWVPRRFQLRLLEELDLESFASTVGIQGEPTWPVWTPAPQKGLKSVVGFLDPTPVTATQERGGSGG